MWFRDKRRRDESHVTLSDQFFIQYTRRYDGIVFAFDSVMSAEEMEVKMASLLHSKKLNWRQKQEKTKMILQVDENLVHL